MQQPHLAPLDRDRLRADAVGFEVHVTDETLSGVAATRSRKRAATDGGRFSIKVCVSLTTSSGARDGAAGSWTVRLAHSDYRCVFAALFNS